AYSVPAQLIDLQQFPDEEREGRIQRLASEEFAKPFDLVHGPLLRTVVFRRAPETHVVLFLVHHIAFDGWSVGIVLQEFAALYEAFAAGKPSPLPELPVQYGDFAVWQRQQLQGAVLDEQLAYWRGRLAGAAPLELQTDRRRPSTPSSRGALRRRVWPLAL